MAHHRVTAVQAGRGDRLLTIAELKSGDRFLDCTCGLGADAIVAAHAVGPRGRVESIETSELLATLVAHGMAYSDHRNPALVAAMRRVTVRHATAEHVLSTLPSQSWDVVYFDPMFDTPVEATTSLGLVRLLAAPDVPNRATLTEARRVARRCVVVKDSATGTLLEQLGLTPVGTTRRHVRYGRG
jgi:tRNA1(Val) A37 N6-methylase TrmN6